jgi:hypothetical protein
MSLAITKLINSFIATNATAYAKASKVFKSIEADDYVTTLAEAGIVGTDIKVYATIWVAKASGVKPHPSQRGGALVFKKDSSEYNRVKYLVDVATGVREARAQTKASKSDRISREHRKAAQAYLAIFEDVQSALAVLRAVAK